MTRLGFVFSILIFFGANLLSAQISPDCSNAVPIYNDTPVNLRTAGYGVDDFNGADRSGCLEKTTSGVIESNSAWYRFRTGASGQLGFNIGVSIDEDWDFALYKADDCSDLGEPIRCNFFDNQDRNSYLGVGEDPTGDTTNIQYEDWLNVEAGEDYYLLLNSFNDTNSGFPIQFSGEIFETNPFDALDDSIVSNLLGAPISVCEGSNVTLNATTGTASSYNWYEDAGAGFLPISGENSAVLVVSTSAIYRVEVVASSGIIETSDVQVGFSALLATFPITDAAACSAELTIDLSAKDSEALGGQDTDEFVVSYHNTLSDANNGTDALSKEFPTPTETKIIYVRVTSVNNADCFDTSESFKFISVDSPSVDFLSQAYLCSDLSFVTIGEINPQPFHTYVWSTGETTSSLNVSDISDYELTIAKTQNGVSCTISEKITVSYSIAPIISDIEIDDLKDDNTVTVVMAVDGNWEYSLNDGLFQDSPVFEKVLAGEHKVTVNDSSGCGLTEERFAVVGFSKFFTPNGDGMNDNWQILGALNLKNPLVSVYDRQGKLLVQLSGSSSGWDGTLNGTVLPADDYWFKLNYTDVDGEFKEAVYLNNHFTLKR